MSHPRSKRPKKICPSQTACDGTLIPEHLDACVKCQEALKRRANKGNHPLRGEWFCIQNLKENEQ